MKKKIFLILVVAAVIGTMCFTAISCDDETRTEVESGEIDMVLSGYYVGTEGGGVDLATAFPGSGYTLAEDCTNATLEGSVITVTAGGDIEVTYVPEGATESKVQVIKGIEGVNVSDWNSFVSAINSSKDPVVQADLTSSGSKAVEIKDSTIYGNAYEIVVNSIVKGNVDNRGENGFVVRGNSKAVFIDAHISGYKYKEGEAVILENCEGYGQLIDATNNDNNSRPSVTLNHCVLENSQKMVYVKGADLVVEGTIMRNGADALLAAETGSVKGANVTVKNSVFANSVVCGIILCGWTAASNNDSYCTLNLEGFVDIYNWKSRDTAKLMPATEGWYVGVVNDLVQGELGKEKYNSYFSKGSDGNDYVHFGIVVLATGDLKANNSKVNGAEGAGLVKKSFPLPGIAATIAHTCILYGIDPKNITIEPTAKMEDNTNLQHELIYGRE